jgi:hypothetical protein
MSYRAPRFIAVSLVVAGLVATAWAADKPIQHQMTPCAPGKATMCGMNDHMGEMDRRMSELHQMTRECMKEDGTCDMDKMMVAMRDMHGRMEKMMNDMKTMHDHPQEKK